MAEEKHLPERDEKPQPAATGTRPERAPTPAPPRELPRYRVLLHNDDVHTMDHVVSVIRTITPLSRQDAERCTLEAHNRGVALLLVTHKERAELYVEQFASCSLTVTAEPEA